MTKRWLSILLVLMLVIPSFGMTAFAVITPPVIESAAATDPDDGTRRVSITPTTATSGQSVKVFYTYGLKSSKPADPTASSPEYKTPFVLKDEGTYVVKAIAYYYTDKGVFAEKTAVASAEIQIGGVVKSLTITPVTAILTGSTTQTYTATVDPASLQSKVEWEIPAGDVALTPSGAEVTGELQADGSYKVTAKGGVGSFKVNAKVAKSTTGGGTTYEVAVSEAVVKAQNVTNFSLPATIEVAVGETVKVEGSVTPATATYAKIDAASADTNKATINDSTVDDKGVNTWTVTGVAKGTTTVKFTANDYDSTDTSNYDKAGISRNVTVNVVDASKTPPTPIFSEPNGKVFTEVDTYGAVTPVVTLDDAVSVPANVATKISTDMGMTWTTYSSVPAVPVNGTITVWAKNVASGNDVYDDGSESDIAKVTYTSEVAVTGITLHTVSTAGTEITTAQSLTGAATLDVYAKVAPFVSGASLAKDPAVTFTSSNEAVAKVEYKKGDTTKTVATVTGTGVGSADITATSADGKKSAKFTVNVTDVTPTTITVTPSSVTVAEGEYVELKAVVADGSNNKAFNQNVTWLIDQPTVASVVDGKVVGISESINGGKAKVIITSVAVPTLSTQVEVTVTPASQGVAKPVVTSAPTGIGSWNSALTAEQTITITTATDGAEIYYTTDGTDPATSATRVKYVEDGFKLNGPAKGTLRVVAIKAGKTNSEEVKQAFNFAIPVTSIEMDKTAEIAVGGTLQLTPVVKPEIATTKTLTWSIAGGTDLATIDKVTGLLTAKKAGIVKITAASTDGTSVSASCIVTIKGAEVADLVIMAPGTGTIEMNTEDVTQLQYRANYVSKTTTGGSWKSSDPTIVTVGSTTGLLTAKKAGTATITLTKDGKTATVQVTVLADPTNIPAEPAAGSTVTYKENTKEFNAIGKATAALELGKISAGTMTMEQLFYYYNVGVTYATSSASAASADEVTFGVAKDGAVTMYIANVPNNSFFFNYTVTLTAKTGRTSNAAAAIPAVTGNVLTVTATPTAIAFAAEKVEDVAMTTAEKKDIVIGKVTNIANFAELGISVTGTSNLGNVTVAADGTVTLTIDKPAEGETTIDVTLSATGCPNVKGPAFKVTVTKAPVTTYEIVVADATQNIEIGQALKAVFTKGGTITLKLNDGTATNWAIKNAKKKRKYVTIDANGVVTMKKATSFVVTAKAPDGKTISRSIQTISNPAAALKAQMKPKKKWVAATSPIAIAAGKKLTVRAAADGKGKVVGLWTTDDADGKVIKLTRKSNNMTAVVTAVSVGTAKITFTNVNGVSITCDVTVGLAAAGAEEKLEVKLGKVNISRK